ncbi:MAG: winged helix-turn-helix transcriptional regulator [Clostridiaceae bacterium]|jgi:predicted transcriptional regulator|nr:winged helix-turn-helix transcriptional regulator [Clostridiaceae bacterium]
MREIYNLDEALELCKVLSSPIRIEIIRILKQNRLVNLNELSEMLGVTNGAITAHIKMLYKEGIIDIIHSPGKRGVQKNCFLKEHKFLINLFSDYKPENVYEVSMPVGSYTQHDVFPTCGLATQTALIGQVDDPRYFDDPKRNDAGILWFTKGFVEYRIPNYLKPLCKVEEIQISMEISSEAPGVCEDWPSNILFFMNDILLGDWISPGDYGNAKGLYTPDWWFDNWNQYGLLKLLTINKEGTFLDGRKLSDITIGKLDLNETSDMKFKLAVTDESKPIGGMTLFGKGFGNYNQDINVRVIFKENPEKNL